MADPGCQQSPARRCGTAVVNMAWLGLSVLLWASVATAQSNQSLEEVDSPGLMIEAVAGWGTSVDRTAPFPVSFLLHNTSERDITGTFTLNDPISGHQVTLGEVFLSPGTTRRFASIQSMSDWYGCVAVLGHGGKVLWRRELPLTFAPRTDTPANVVLFIDRDGRRLPLPDSVADAGPINPPVGAVNGLRDHPVLWLTAKPWQIPHHPGPLIVALAMVFHDGATERDLNQAQWRAVAEWMCQGGTVFVHDQSKEILARLIDSAPLASDIAVKTGPFMVRRIGLGAICEFPGSLFSEEAAAIRQSINITAGRLHRNSITTFADSGYLRLPRDGAAIRNRILVLAFFGLYTLLSGVVAFFLFRLSRRQITVYIVVTVTIASALAALLGGYLRFSPGDLYWVTVTQAGVGGLIQVGSIEVQSAGSRNTRVAVKGERPDLQFIGTEQYYNYYGTPRQTGYSPFTWQRNLAAGDEHTYQINVPMTLWGRRRCHATDYQRDLPRLDFELDFKPDGVIDEIADGQNIPPAPAGTLSLKLANRLPFHLKSCWLVVGITHRTALPADPGSGNPISTSQFPSASAQRGPLPVDGLIDLYHVRRLKDLPGGEVRDEQFSSLFLLRQQNPEMAGLWPNGSWIPPTIPRLGTATAWIIGCIDSSSIMSIDEPKSDFIPQREIHLFIQEILPEDMPDSLKFSDPATFVD